MYGWRSWKLELPFTESGSPWSNGLEGDREIGVDRLHWGDLSDIQVEMSNQIYGLTFRGENCTE